MDALAEIRAAPPPRDWVGTGRAWALAGVALLLVVSAAGKQLGLGPSVATPLLVAGGVLLVAGIVLWLGAGGFARGHATAAVEAALRTLEAGEEDREVLLRAATLLLCNAWATHGPATVAAFDFGAARGRLGARLELVAAVEGVLLEEGVIDPVFTPTGDGV